MAAAAEPARRWITSDLDAVCRLSQKEIAQAADRAWEDITAGVEPVADGVTPLLLLTIGPPGAGKSTVGVALAEAELEASNGSFIHLDFDLGIKYHPRYNGIWDISDIRGQKTGVGFAEAYRVCVDEASLVMAELMHRFFTSAARYNIVLQIHSQLSLVEGKQYEFRTILAYLYVPEATAVRRARTRAVETGKFLAQTLAEQDDWVKQLYAKYKVMSPWYGMWADEFIVVDNSEDRPAAGRGPAVLKDCVRRFDLHGPDWYTVQLEFTQFVAEAEARAKAEAERGAPRPGAKKGRRRARPRPGALSFDFL